MNFVERIRSWVHGNMTPSEHTLGTWFHVTFDDNEIHWNVTPPGREAWSASCRWEDIVRVCFKTSESFETSDDVFIFSKHRPESYVVPTEAHGGSELWSEILK